MARRRHQEEHENHERWLVSYADFITLLFAFFVVMYSISSINEGKYKILSESLTGVFNQPDRSIKPIPVGEERPRTSEPDDTTHDDPSSDSTLQSIASSFYLYSNDSFQEISAPSLTEIEGSLQVEWHTGGGAETVSMPNLEEIGGSLYFYYSYYIEEVDLSFVIEGWRSAV